MEREIEMVCWSKIARGMQRDVLVTNDMVYWSWVNFGIDGPIDDYWLVTLRNVDYSPFSTMSLLVRSRCEVMKKTRVGDMAKDEKLKLLLRAVQWSPSVLKWIRGYEGPELEALQQMSVMRFPATLADCYPQTLELALLVPGHGCNLKWLRSHLLRNEVETVLRGDPLDTFSVRIAVDQ